MKHRNHHAVAARARAGGPHESERDDDAPPVAYTADDWIGAVMARLEAGRDEYGDGSFSMPVGRLLEMLSEEALDLGGWAYVASRVISHLIDREDTLRGARPYLSAVYYGSPWPPPDVAAPLSVHVAWVASLGARVHAHLTRVADRYCR